MNYVDYENMNNGPSLIICGDLEEDDQEEVEFDLDLYDCNDGELG